MFVISHQKNFLIGEEMKKKLAVVLFVVLLTISLPYAEVQAGGK